MDQYDTIQENRADMFHNTLTYVHKICKCCNWKYICILTFCFITILYNLKIEEERFRDHKIVLILTSRINSYFPLVAHGSGQKSFEKLNCPVKNCYVTHNRYLLHNITEFDAIVFDLRPWKYPIGLPKHRSPHQKYILYAMESSEMYPVCNKIYDDFFNWTYTYKLDSDIVCNYFTIKDANNEIVGPKRDMVWVNNASDVTEDIVKNLKKKSKVAAWFVSCCRPRSKREVYVSLLNKALKAYNLTVDVYGACGQHKCPKSKRKMCEEILRRDYYFYLSFENSFAEDYVTEKLLTALNLDTVPIVYGLANYSRFLPPGSYIDASSHSPENLAKLMHTLMESPKAYQAYFKWRNHYMYSDAERYNVCNFCAALHDKKMLAPSVRRGLRKWMHPNYKSRCNL